MIALCALKKRVGVEIRAKEARAGGILDLARVGSHGLRRLVGRYCRKTFEAIGRELVGPEKLTL